MIYIKDGDLIIDNEIVKINYLCFLKEISRGANGIVFLANDIVLDRKVAFKIWLKLRTKDIRNKKTQGLYEAKKLCSAKDIISGWHDEKLDNPYFISDESDILSVSEQIVGQIYYAGYHKDYFYTVMEFIDGVTLEAFLTESFDSLGYVSDDKMKIGDDRRIIPLGVKVNIASKLIQYNEIFMKNNIVHGDLHWRNIMITKFLRQRPYASLDFHHSYDLKIIDFGTSYFSGKEVSVERSFATLLKTINHCIYPFKLEEIKACKEPTDRNNVDNMTLWLQRQLYALRAAFFELGQEYVGWPLYRAFGTYEITRKGYDIETKHVKDMINKHIQDGRIELSKQFIGVSEDWDTFDGRTAIRGD